MAKKSGGGTKGVPAASRPPERSAASTAGREAGEAGCARQYLGEAGGDATEGVKGGEPTREGTAGPPSNTYTPFRHENGCGGVDWLGVSCFVEWDLEQFKSNITELEILKQNAGKVKGGDSSAIWVAGGMRYLVHRRGASHTGGVEGGVFFEFKVESEGVQFHVSRRPMAAGSQPNVYVQIGSCPLMENGHVRMWWKALGMLKCLGAKVERAVLSRADLCADLPGQDVKPFVRAMERGQVIKKALKWRPYYYGVDGTTGFECGAEMKLRIYDKVMETEHDPIKRELLTRLRWGGEVPEKATRVEFCIRRGVMRDKSVQDIEDAFDKLPAIAEFLTHDWFRMVRGFDRENRNHGRAITHKLWRRVLEGFKWTGQTEHTLVKRQARPDVDQAIAAVWGNLSTAAAVEGRVLSDREMVRQYLLEKLKVLDVERLVEGQERKFTKLEAAYPSLDVEADALPF